MTFWSSWTSPMHIQNFSLRMSQGLFKGSTHSLNKLLNFPNLYYPFQYWYIQTYQRYYRKKSFYRFGGLRKLILSAQIQLCSIIYLFLFFMGWDWVHLLLRPLLAYCTSHMIDGDCGAICGMWIGSGNSGTRRKPAPVPPHTPHDLSGARNGAAAVGSRRLTAWAMARSHIYVVP
jgi:hypothetical protein